MMRGGGRRKGGKKNEWLASMVNTRRGRERRERERMGRSRNVERGEGRRRTGQKSEEKG